jgi:tetratricopeptide (TPR) repeat protein
MACSVQNAGLKDVCATHAIAKVLLLTRARLATLAGDTESALSLYKSLADLGRSVGSSEHRDDHIPLAESGHIHYKVSGWHKMTSSIHPPMARHAHLWSMPAPDSPASACEAVALHVALQSGNLAKAKQFYRRALQKAPQSCPESVYLRLGECFLASADTTFACDTFMAAVQLKPSASAWLGVGTAYMRRGNRTTAAAAAAALECPIRTYSESCKNAQILRDHQVL